MQRYANKGKGLELEVIISNRQYKDKGIAVIQQIPTPVKIYNVRGRRVTGVLTSKSTLDFRGTLKPNVSISLDCKETIDKDGLKLNNIADHQIQYMRSALSVGEISFIVCYMKSLDKRYYIPGNVVLRYWDEWQKNKGKHGYNTILIEDMIEIKSKDGILLDYLEPIRKEISEVSNKIIESLKYYGNRPYRTPEEAAIEKRIINTIQAGTYKKR